MFKLKLLPLLFAIFLLASCASAPRFNRGNSGSATYAPKKRTKVKTKSRVQPKSTKKIRGEDVDINSSSMKKIIDNLIGIPYKWGGTTRRGMDCSGFVQFVYKKAERIVLPHNAKKQAGYGRKISKNSLEFGDLIFFKNKGRSIDHVGISLGGKRFVHASVSRGVTISKLSEKYYKKRYYISKRLHF